MKPERKNNFVFWESKAVFALVLFIASLFGYYAFNILSKSYQEKQENAMLDGEIANLQEKQTDLQSQKNTLTDPEYIEREARLKLNYKKEGEQVVVLVDGTNNQKDSQTKENQTSLKSPSPYVANLQKWIEVIFK